MFAVVMTVELHVPASGSLKAKRGVLKSIAAKLRNELKVSVAEVDHQDLWQRATLGVAIAAGSEIGARKVAQQVEKVVSRELRVEIIGVHIDVVAPER